MNNQVQPAAVQTGSGPDGRCERAVGCIGLKHWILLIVLFLYSLMGGAVMRELEDKAWHNRKMSWNNKLDTTERRLAQWVAQYYGNMSCAMVDFNSTNSTLLTSIHSHVENLDIYEDTKFSHWNLMDATFYAFTICTTIGEFF